MTPEEADQLAKDTITKIDKQAAAESDTSTQFSTTLPDVPVKDTVAVKVEKEESEVVEVDDPIVARLKKRVESMVGKIEAQLSETENKIGDKLHFLDKDKDGILTPEEMAGVLQFVLKRELSFEDAMEIANAMVSNVVKVFFLFFVDFKYKKYSNHVLYSLSNV